MTSIDSEHTQHSRMNPIWMRIQDVFLFISFSFFAQIHHSDALVKWVIWLFFPDCKMEWKTNFPTKLHRLPENDTFIFKNFLNQNFMLFRVRNHLFNLSTDTRINFLKVWHLFKILQLQINKSNTENVKIFKRKNFLTELYLRQTEKNLEKFYNFFYK